MTVNAQRGPRDDGERDVIGGGNATCETDNNTWIQEHVIIQFKGEQRRSHVPQRKNPANVTAMKMVSGNAATWDATMLTGDYFASGEADGHCR
jgi:hypothetical protein